VLIRGFDCPPARGRKVREAVPPETKSNGGKVPARPTVLPLAGGRSLRSPKGGRRIGGRGLLGLGAQTTLVGASTPPSDLTVGVLPPPYGRWERSSRRRDSLRKRRERRRGWAQIRGLRGAVAFHCPPAGGRKVPPPAGRRVEVGGRDPTSWETGRVLSALSGSLHPPRRLRRRDSLRKRRERRGGGR